MHPPVILLFIGGYYLLFVFGLLALLYLRRVVSGRISLISGAILFIIFGVLSLYALATAEDYLSAPLGINFIYMLVSSGVLFLILPERRFGSSRTNTEKASIIIVLGIIPMFLVEELWLLTVWGIQPPVMALGLSVLSMAILYIYRSVRGYLIALMILSFLFYLSFTLFGISIGYSETASFLLNIPVIFLAVATYFTAKTLFNNLAKNEIRVKA